MNFINKKTHSRQIQKNKHDTELKLRSYAYLTAEELFTHLSSSHTGLTNHEVENRQDEFGKNVITTGNKNTTL
ncbi:TPA: cation-transporting P-type ATPase, partial [Streptococcus suis]